MNQRESNYWEEAALAARETEETTVDFRDFQPPRGVGHPPRREYEKEKDGGKRERSCVHACV